MDDQAYLEEAAQSWRWYEQLYYAFMVLVVVPLTVVFFILAILVLGAWQNIVRIFKKENIND